ncbi:MAG: peptidoglycan DD-metalloendopeptidase family protein [Cyclobacteriaceae bacterium]
MSKRVMSLLVLGVFSVALFFLIPMIQGETEVEPEADATASAELIPMDSVEMEPETLYGISIESMTVIEDKVRRNQNISEILSGYNVSSQTIFDLANKSKDVFDVRKIATNKKYTLICEQDSLRTATALVYEHNPIEYVIFNLKDSVYVEKKARDVKIVEKSAAGIIESSLAVTMQDLGLSPALTDQFVDVFGWQLDFFGLQKGDRFKVIYEEKEVEGNPVGIGEIKAIYFQHFGNDYYAFNFDQGSGVDYFDEEGNSLRKALLKYPLEFTRISSRYSGRRYHPVQKRYKAHRGTDFAAPRGTPIRAVGDGIILEAKFKKYNGNYVKIKHNNTYSTQYLHMSKIASGIRPGAKVKQGQTIGYVGSTGLATGNHLCYRFWKNGVQVDALKVNLPPSEPVAENNKDAFFMRRDELIERLDAVDMPKDTPQVLASMQ